MDSLRDWGHAKDYVKMQWMMLQQEQPEDFVIATGVQYSVRQFVEMAAAQLGIKLRFEGTGVEEKGTKNWAGNRKSPSERWCLKWWLMTSKRRKNTLC